MQTRGEGEGVCWSSTRGRKCVEVQHRGRECVGVPPRGREWVRVQTRGGGECV